MGGLLGQEGGSSVRRGRVSCFMVYYVVWSYPCNIGFPVKKRYACACIGEVEKKSAWRDNKRIGFIVLGGSAWYSDLSTDISWG